MECARMGERETATGGMSFLPSSCMWNKYKSGRIAGRTARGGLDPRKVEAEAEAGATAQLTNTGNRVGNIQVPLYFITSTMCAFMWRGCASALGLNCARGGETDTGGMNLLSGIKAGELLDE